MASQQSQLQLWPNFGVFDTLTPRSHSHQLTVKFPSRIAALGPYDRGAVVAVADGRIWSVDVEQALAAQRSDRPRPALSRPTQGPFAELCSALHSFAGGDVEAMPGSSSHRSAATTRVVDVAARPAGLELHPANIPSVICLSAASTEESDAGVLLTASESRGTAVVDPGAPTKWLNDGDRAPRCCAVISVVDMPTAAAWGVRVGVTLVVLGGAHGAVWWYALNSAERGSLGSLSQPVVFVGQTHQPGKVVVVGAGGSVALCSVDEHTRIGSVPSPLRIGSVAYYGALLLTCAEGAVFATRLDAVAAGGTELKSTQLELPQRVTGIAAVSRLGSELTEGSDSTVVVSMSDGGIQWLRPASVHATIPGATRDTPARDTAAREAAVKDSMKALSLAHRHLSSVEDEIATANEQLASLASYLLIRRDPSSAVACSVSVGHVPEVVGAMDDAARELQMLCIRLTARADVLRHREAWDIFVRVTPLVDVSSSATRLGHTASIPLENCHVDADRNVEVNVALPGQLWSWSGRAVGSTVVPALSAAASQYRTSAGLRTHTAPVLSDPAVVKEEALKVVEEGAGHAVAQIPVAVVVYLAIRLPVRSAAAETTGDADDASRLSGGTSHKSEEVRGESGEDSRESERGESGEENRESEEASRVGGFCVQIFDGRLDLLDCCRPAGAGWHASTLRVATTLRLCLPRAEDAAADGGAPKNSMFAAVLRAGDGSGDPCGNWSWEAVGGGKGWRAYALHGVSCAARPVQVDESIVPQADVPDGMCAVLLVLRAASLQELALLREAVVWRAHATLRAALGRDGCDGHGKVGEPGNVRTASSRLVELERELAELSEVGDGEFISERVANAAAQFYVAYQEMRAARDAR